jgi:hypothetical protein
LWTISRIGRVKVDALHLAAQSLPLSKARHHLQGVAEDHAVRPILVVLVEFGLVYAFGDSVEVREQIGREVSGLVLALRRLVESPLPSSKMICS